MKEFFLNYTQQLKIYIINEDAVLAKPDANVIELQNSIGVEVEKRLQKCFVHSFFSQNLCEKKSLMGRISSGLFLICKTARLNRFKRFNQNSKLGSIVIKVNSKPI